MMMIMMDKTAAAAISPLVSRKFPWLYSIPHAPTIKDNNLLALYFIASLAISAEHSFWLHHHSFPSNVKQAAKLYIKSSAAISVSQQIQAAFQHKSSEIPNISQEKPSQYISHIVLSLSDIICNNFLAHK